MFTGGKSVHIENAIIYPQISEIVHLRKTNIKTGICPAASHKIPGGVSS